MRDAFGGAFMIKLFLVFIAIYIGFTAVALNYAKAFKVKNKVIEYLESSEISSLNSITSTQLEDLESFFESEVLGNMKYNQNHLSVCNKANEFDYAGQKKVHCDDIGIKIEEVSQAKNTEGVYYRVSTYVGWSIPFLNNLLALNGNNASRPVPIGVWEISGETRLIVNG